jgi:nucleoside phosphorylase
MDSEADDFRCDILLFIATSTEEEQLKLAANSMGLPFEGKKLANGERYFRVGMVGNSKVNAVRTKLGPFSHGGSASRAIHYHIATGATAIIQLGMAFGVDPSTQKIGDVLVSTSLIPYDLREIRSLSASSLAIPKGEFDLIDSPNTEDHLDAVEAHGPSGGLDTIDVLTDPQLMQDKSGFGVSSSHDRGEISPVKPYKVDYKWAERHRAKESLIGLFSKERDRNRTGHNVFLGGILSGGARIFSRDFLKEPIIGVPQAEDGIIGGEMEGVGLLSVSPPENPIWAVVKGISDFADEDRDKIIKRTRPVACQNSSRFVLSAIMNADPE